MGWSTFKSHFECEAQAFRLLLLFFELASDPAQQCCFLSVANLTGDKMTFKCTLISAISVAALVSVSATAFAQEAEQIAANELPPVVIEGATIEAKPVAKPKVKPAPVVAEEPEPAPQPAVKKKKSVAKASVANGPAKTAPAPQPESETSAASSQNGAVSSTAAVSDPPVGAGEGSETINGIAAEKVGTSVSVVTGAQLRAQQVRHAADALRSLPGVSVSQQGSFGSLTQVRIRGAEANQTLVLIDGIEVNDPSDGGFDFANLSADDIERIEVLRGPQSGLYGSKAVGGVINIITRGGRGPLTFTGRVEGGSFNTRDVSGRVSAGNDRGYFSLGYGRRATDGFNTAPVGSEEDDNRLSTFNMRAGMSVADGLAVDFNIRNSRRFGNFDDFCGNPGPLCTAFDADNESSSNVWATGGKLTWDTLDGALTHVFKAQLSSTERESKQTFSTGKNNGDHENFSYAATYRLNTPDLLGARHFFTGLAEREIEHFTPLSDFGFFGKADGIERTRSLNAGAFEYRGEYADLLFVTGTVREDDHDTFGQFTTWRTTAALALREIGLRPHASYGTGVKLPTMFENFGSIPGSFSPNPNLAPERSEGWDAGVEATVIPGIAIVDLTYFSANLTDKINGFAPTPVFGVFTAENLPGESTREGIEVASRIALSRDLSLGLSYTFTDAEDPDGKQEIRRSPHTARGDLTYLFDAGRGTISVAAIYNGTNTDLAFEQAAPFGSRIVDLDDYWLVNAAASYKVQPGVELFGRVENVLDQDYQEVFGFETAGVAAYAGVRISYEEPSTLSWSQYK